jgi:hypothetical protein
MPNGLGIPHPAGGGTSTPPQPTSEEIQELKQKLDEAEQKLRESEERLRREPASDGHTTVLEILMRKLSLINQFQGLLTPLGAINLSEDQLSEMRKAVRRNIGPPDEPDSGILRRILRELIGIIRDIVEDVIGILVDLAKEIASIFEEAFGDAQVEEVDAKTFKVAGSSTAVNLRFGKRLRRHGFPSVAGPFKGMWQATLVSDGTEADGSRRYRVTTYLSEVAEVAIGPVTLNGLRQTLDPEEDSFFVVGANGAVSGTLYTRFRAQNWTDEVGVPAITTVTGTITNKVLKYRSSGEDFVWASRLLPDLQPAIKQPAQPIVVNSAGALSVYSPDRFIGAMVRKGVSPVIADALNLAVEKYLPIAFPISTADLRRLSDLACENPFEEEVISILKPGANVALLKQK